MIDFLWMWSAHTLLYQLGIICIVLYHNKNTEKNSPLITLLLTWSLLGRGHIKKCWKGIYSYSIIQCGVCTYLVYIYLLSALVRLSRNGPRTPIKWFKWARIHLLYFPDKLEENWNVRNVRSYWHSTKATTVTKDQHHWTYPIQL